MSLNSTCLVLCESCHEGSRQVSCAVITRKHERHTDASYVTLAHHYTALYGSKLPAYGTTACIDDIIVHA